MLKTKHIFVNHVSTNDILKSSVKTCDPKNLIHPYRKIVCIYYPFVVHSKSLHYSSGTFPASFSIIFVLLYLFGCAMCINFLHSPFCSRSLPLSSLEIIQCPLCCWFMVSWSPHLANLYAFIPYSKVSLRHSNFKVIFCLESDLPVSVECDINYPKPIWIAW